MSEPTLVAVVAMARNGVIGRNGEMPWHLPSDLKRYRALTMGKPMIMGRKTLDSIGRCLDGRDTIVVTRHGAVPYPGAIVAADPDAALAMAQDCARRRGTDEIVIAGGAEIYTAFLDRTDRLHVTLVEADPVGDTTFPAIDPRVWRLVQDEALVRGEKDSFDRRSLLYERR